MACLRSQSSRNRHIIILCTCSVCWRLLKPDTVSIFPHCIYLSTKVNVLADNLSQDTFVKGTRCQCIPVQFSTALLDLLLSPEVDWVSLEWQSLFSGISKLASIRNTYNTWMKQFYALCEKYTPFLVYEQLHCCFVAYLAHEGLSPHTAKSYLLTVRNAQWGCQIPVRLHLLLH